MKLKALKLNTVSKAELRNREMNKLLGGSSCCVCGCNYEHSGGSSQVTNGNANHRGGLWSPGGGSYAPGAVS